MYAKLHKSKRPRLKITETAQGKSTSHHATLHSHKATEAVAATSSVPATLIAQDNSTILDEFDNEEAHQKPTSSNPALNEWLLVQRKLLDIYYEEQQFDQKKCGVCDMFVAKSNHHIKCTDCGSNGYFCSRNCFKTIHNGNCNPFHKPMEWMQADMKYQHLYTCISLTRRDHQCASLITRTGITVYDIMGRVHIVSIDTCKCEEECVTYLRHGLWAATTKQPRTSFHIDLLRSIKYLMIEGKCSLLSICNSLRWRNELSIAEGEKLYNRLRGEPMEQFRHFMYQARSFKFLSLDLDDGTSCLACPKDNGDLFVSMDGNLGLVRKKSSGSTMGLGNHGTRMFMDQEDTGDDDYVDKHVECSNFEAGNILRSKSTSKKLDVSGVFGSACRHGVPLSFIDMKKGESLTYSVRVIDELLNRTREKNLKLHVLYDIGCKLDARLKRNPEYKDVDIAVPVFHAYGHKASCQVKSNARWNEGYGLTDGEDMERLWSELRRLSFITKEMTYAHRRDLLTDALLHYARKKNSEMDVTLSKRLMKANHAARHTEEELQLYLDGMSYTEADKMVTNEKQRISTETGVQLTAEEKYVKLLVDYAKQQKKLSTSTENSRKHHEEELERVDRELKKTEKRLGHTDRWQSSSPNYKSHQQTLQVKLKTSLLSKMYEEAQEYDFIQSLKGKYGDRNQKIGIRLKKQVIRASKSIKRSLARYNSSGFVSPPGGIPDSLKYSDVNKPDNQIYQYLHKPSDITPGCTRQRCQKIAELRCRQLRAEEERGLVMKEMLSLLDAVGMQHLHILNTIQRDDTGAGIQMALVHQLDILQDRYFRARKIFSEWLTDLPEIPTHLFQVNLLDVIDDIVEDSNLSITSDCDVSSDDEEDKDGDYYYM